MLHPAEAVKVPYVQQVLGATEGPIVAASDYMKSVQDQVSPWLGGRMLALGTDGFGRSDNRTFLRGHFEVNAASIAVAALSRLAREGKFDAKKAAKAIGELGVNPEKIDPAVAQYYWVIKEQFVVDLFCGITPFRARPTGEALRGVYRGPGESRGARRPACAFEELLQRVAVTR